MSATLYFKNETGMVDLGEDKDLNMANANARHFLRALGLNTNFENAEYTLDQFFNSLLKYINSSEQDKGRETKTDFGVAGKSICIIECGLPEDYVMKRAQYAISLCIDARKLGATDCYFC